MLEEMVELKYHADFAAQAMKNGRRVAATAVQRQFFEVNGSRLKTFKARDNPQHCGLARSGWAHQCHQFAAPYVKRDASQDLPRATDKAHLAQTKHRVHAVGAFHRFSSRRAKAASGSDMAR
jgi:hypothetical protein